MFEESLGRIRRERHLGSVRCELAEQDADQQRHVLGALRAVRLLRNPTLKIYPGASHGLPMTHASELNQDVLDFIGR